MEVVNVGSISVEGALEILFDRCHLMNLMGGHGALCFILVRDLAAPGIYSQLIEHAATIDSTTRNHIAFVLFYGESSAIMQRVDIDYRPYMARYQIHHLSYFGPEGMDIHVQAESRLPNRKLDFDRELGEGLKCNPSQVNAPALSRYMGRAANCLMDR